MNEPTTFIIFVGIAAILIYFAMKKIKGDGDDDEDL